MRSLRKLTSSASPSSHPTATSPAASKHLHFFKHHSSNPISSNHTLTTHHLTHHKMSPTEPQHNQQQPQDLSQNDQHDSSWKHDHPYKKPDKPNDDNSEFKVHWEGSCHCGQIQYVLGREAPLASKYCHCGDCQTMHAVCTYSLVLYCLYLILPIFFCFASCLFVYFWCHEINQNQQLFLPLPF